MLKHLNRPVEVIAALALAVALNLRNPAKRFVTLCDVVLRYNGYELVIPAGYEWDGPSIPRLLWWIVGLSPADVDTILASLFHDFLCERPDILPRVVADAIFCQALGPIVYNGELLPGVGPKRRAAMYFAVRSWSIVSGADPLLRGAA